MKRTTKTIMAFLTAMTMTAGAMGVTAYAEEQLIDASKEGIRIDVLDPDRYINLTDEQREALKSYSQFREDSKEKSDNIFSMADLYTYRQGNELFQRYVKIDDYIGQNKIDALCLIHGYGDNLEDYIHIDYITDNGKEDVEAFLSENDISTDRVEIKEMERSQKCEYIALNKVNQFIKLNELSCRIRPLVPTDNSATAYDGGINVLYDAQHEDDKKTVEEYITEHGYDKELPVSYTLAEPDDLILKNNDVKFLEENVVNATMKGDADLNDEVNLADLTTVAKYNLSSSSYPLENKTAFANADMNDDGVVDGLDTSILIEQQLGKK